jgi:topoisomerase IA-like protein
MNAIAAALILLLQPLQEKEPSKDPDVRKVYISAENQTITEILEKLRQETGIPIEYQNSAKEFLNPDKTRVTFKVDSVTLHVALTLLFLPRGLTVDAVDKKKIVIFLGP